ncbi:MAG: hypothetical protein JW884_12185 [Deltaproteobacteria bacterium]|nr:hypothetical protein [Deltaproteobacteria bacterium]
MKKVTLILVVCLGLAAYGALNYHIVVLDGGVKLLKKVHLSLDRTVVDARGPKKAKLLVDPVLLKAGIRDLVTEQSFTIKTK